MELKPVEKLRRELRGEELKVNLTFEKIKCESTEEAKPLEGIIGQEKAVKAIRFGLEMKEKGFNIYLSGKPGTGRTTAIKEFLQEIAKGKPTPNDWCYVYNFKDPYRPISIRLPPGKGIEFKRDVENLIEYAKINIPRAFQSEEYTSKREAIIRRVEEKQRKILEELDLKARREGFIIRSSPAGIILTPIIDGKPLSDETLMKMKEEERRRILEKQSKILEEFRETIKQVRMLEFKVNEELKELDKEVAAYSIEHVYMVLKEKYKGNEDVESYLNELHNDIIKNYTRFLGKKMEKEEEEYEEYTFLRRYEVNVIVDNSNLNGAPVVVEYNPTYVNLIGKIEKETRYGLLYTDHTMIRAGALHKANGGYLVIQVEDVLRNPFAWDGLKLALRYGYISIEEPSEVSGLTTVKGLRPTPIPLDIKVILIGTPLIYELLMLYDPDFKELFKVKAEFDTVMELNDENIEKYISFICTLCKKENLKHLDAKAVKRLIEYSSRLAGSQDKISTIFSEISDIIREASFYAKMENSKFIMESHIKRALEEKVYRTNLIEEKILELIKRGIILIDVHGKAIGQVNGLSIIQIGELTFGKPVRITATVGLGREGIINIEREAELSGPIHTKGVMIISGYLTEKYAYDKPLTLSARLVFEQSYEGVEGDSASSAELYALLSALSGIPIKQSIAVTGSVNQKGEIQAVGGINEKIEGFYKVCKIKGLNGEQGVIIPESNIKDLNLHDEVIEAVEKGLFHIYPIKTIDEGIEILTGIKAGERKPDGGFEEGTINYLVDKKLREFAEKTKEFYREVIR
ncbi:MAG: ATP-binding protein [Candidatus Methanomethylicia archaeon]